VTLRARLRHAVAPGRTALVAALVVGAIVTNVVQWPSVEQMFQPEMEAIGRSNSSDIAATSYLRCAWCRQRYGLHTALGVIAPGARVIIATPSAYAPDRETADEISSRLRVFGRVDSIVWVRSDVALESGFDPTPYVIVSGDGGTKGGPWALAVDPKAIPPGGGHNPDEYLNEIVTGEGPARSDTVREFVLIRWQKARPHSSYRYQELLVETSLLPASVRNGLSG